MESPLSSINPEELTRLKRPLSSPTSGGNSKRKKRSPASGGHHSQRKGFWTSLHKGVSRASMLSLTAPVSTEEEVSLFSKLLQDTRVTRSHGAVCFIKMAEIWNSEVILALQQDQEAGNQGVSLLPKTERQLRAFHRDVSQTLCVRRGAGFVEALSGVAAAGSPSLAPSAQGCLKVMRDMIAIMPGSSRPQAQLRPPAVTAPLRKTFSSVARDGGKFGRQGEGSKRCVPCGWKPAADGTGMGLTEHRKVCQVYQAKYPKKKK